MPLATYYYAIRHGSRLPLEGVPYTFLFALFFGTALSIFSLTSFVAQWALATSMRSAHAIFTRVRSTREKRMADAEAFRESTEWEEDAARGPLILALAVGVLLVFGAVVWNTYRQGIHSGAPVFREETIRSGAMGVAGFISIQIVMGLGWALSSRVFEAVSKYFSLFSYLAAVAISLWVLFSDGFNTALRVVHYGGGQAINLVLQDGAKVYNRTLFLRSQNILMTWNPESALFEEYMLEHIVSIEYQPISSWTMPPSELPIQWGQSSNSNDTQEK